MKVFIVDDSMLIRAWIKLLLSDYEQFKIAGYSSSVDHSIKKIKELRPDLIFIDVKLKDGSGIDVLKKIRPENPDAIIIIMTGYSNQELKYQSEMSGADYYFNKATDLENIERVLTEVAI